MLMSMLVAAGLAAQEPVSAAGTPAADAAAELTPYEAMRRAADSVERVPNTPRRLAKKSAGEGNGRHI